METAFITAPGEPLPLGPHCVLSGVNFAVFSRNAISMTLEIYEAPTDSAPVFSYKLDPRVNKTGDIWHLLLVGQGPGLFFLWRADGPYEPEHGLRFNVHKALLDPYAQALTGNYQRNFQKALAYDPSSPDGDLSFSTEDDAGAIPKCVVVSDSFDWKGDQPLNYPLRNCLIYEAHVKGLSRHQSSGVSHPGTFLGVVESIPYLKKLGITSLELLPVQEFDEFDNLRHNPLNGSALTNYWGYATLCFFAPKASYSASGRNGEQVNEFKLMVRELHAAGIEVILDIVFNHTAEGSELGPTFSFRGLDNQIYYMLDSDERHYRNFSGCGNTVNCNHPVVRGFIMDCLHYWVSQMHVDGFRFDLGSILGRDQNGKLLENPPVVEQIAEDPLLRRTKIIAEAWDAGGAYQVGLFPGRRWAEWNDRFRDDVRRFWRGDERAVQGFATRVTGSSDLYLDDGRKPFHSINYVTSHDGFTLNDLVSYNGKHNEENGEASQDGMDSNYSFNYGYEGKTDDPLIEALRGRQIKNFIATLLLSQGTPMLLAGDEFRRTQNGNNNAFCQDNETSWLDFGLARKNADIERFEQELIAFRKRHPSFRRAEFFTGRDSNLNGMPDVCWYDEKLQKPDWSKIEHRLAWLIDGSEASDLADQEESDFYLICNADTSPCIFRLPEPRRGRWYCVADTSHEAPKDILAPGREELIQPQNSYPVAQRSFVLLMSR